MHIPRYRTPKQMFQLLISCFIVIVCLLAAFPSTSAAGDESVVIYVDGSASGFDNGESWGNAFKDLQQALTEAKKHIPGKKVEIWVAKGTYKPTVDGDRTKSFVLSNGIALYGGFDGTEAAREGRKPAENHTILSGAIDGGQKSYHVVYADGVNETSVLDGFTITGGNANDDDTNKDGGGMYINLGAPTVTNCTFFENEATNGGGMYIQDGSATVTDCSFSKNNATNHGGGMYMIAGSQTVTDCKFSGNEATVNGGGMCVSGGSAKVASCAFEDNKAKNGGGGMQINDGSPTVINCTFEENNAFYGGGMRISGANSNPTLMNCTFPKNTAKRGGGMYILGGSPTVTSCTFEENAAGLGGGMLIGIANLEMTNCTFWKNEATEDGGGMYIQDANSKPTLMNCTFSENSAADGDGIYINSGTPTVTNTIFWGAGFATGQVVKQGGNLTITYSVVDTALFSDEGNINADPKLGPLADNGGPTLTCALLEDSSAIDSGTASGSPKSDQRGVPRPQGGGVDMGAYERAPEKPDSPEVDPWPDAPGGGGCSAGPASPWTLALLAPLAPLAVRRRPDCSGR